MPSTLQKYRVIKQPGKPVGPHVDWARDAAGNIVRGRPYRDPVTGVEHPGDLQERQYLPGDEVWSEVDLTQAVDGPDEIEDVNPETGKVVRVKVNKSGLNRLKFEKVATPHLTEEEEYEAAKQRIAEFEARKSQVHDAAKAGADNVNQQGQQNKPQRVSAEVLDKKNYKELLDLAKAEGIDIKGASKKEELVKVLLAALNG